MSAVAFVIQDAETSPTAAYTCILIKDAAWLWTDHLVLEAGTPSATAGWLSSLDGTALASARSMQIRIGP
jgi:hypothetical protein